MKIFIAILIFVQSLGVFADDNLVVGKIWQDRKTGTQLQLKCLLNDNLGNCNEFQYFLSKGGRVAPVGPTFSDEIFKFDDETILEDIDRAIVEVKKTDYIEIAKLFPNGMFPLTENYYSDNIETAGAIIFVSTLVGAILVGAFISTSPVTSLVIGSVLALSFAGAPLADLIVLSGKGVASVGVGVADVGIAVKNGVVKGLKNLKENVKNRKLKKAFRKLSKGINENPVPQKIRHKLFNQLVQALNGLNFEGNN